MLDGRGLIRGVLGGAVLLAGIAAPLPAGAFDVGGLLGGVMQTAIQAEQQRRAMEQQQLMLQQQQQYERQLQLLQRQNAYRQQQYNAPTPLPSQAQATPANAGPYLVIDGHTLGDTLTPQSLPADFTCHPSEQFADAQWCRSRKVNNEVWTSTSIILTSASTIAYYSKLFEDATFQAGSVAGEIDRLSALHHQPAHVMHMPGSSRELGATIATWGGVTLTQIDPVAANTLKTGGSVTAGVLVDFLNNVRDSAKRGLPIYRITGGAGYYWVARYDRTGKGSLRFGVANAQVYDVPKPAAPVAPAAATATSSSTETSSAPVQVASVEKATAVDGTTRAAITPAQQPSPPPTVAVTPAPSASTAMPVIPDQGRRVALVIGNSAYREVPALANPKHDADAVAAALTSAGFDVTLVSDLDLSGMTKALRDFRDKADAADWAMVYYAGHGIEVGGTNYLIPIDARLSSDRDVEDEAISLDRVRDRLSNAKKLRLVVLDACRENPFDAKMQRRDSYRDVARGLARVEPNRRDELVFFAAKDHELAQDGSSDGHSPFAKAFIARLATPGLEVNRMFRYVIADVMDATHDGQQPFVYGSTGSEDYYFRAQ